MRRFRAGVLTAVAVLTLTAPLLLPVAGVVDGAVAEREGAGRVRAEPVIGRLLAHVELRDVSGHRVGWVEIVPLFGGTNLVTVRATRLSPGFHGIHLHAVGVCDPSGPIPFASAGPHLNPSGAAEGMQAGALPVLLAGRDGTGAAAFTDPNFRMDDLTGPTGSAVVIHSGPDNYANVPDRYSAAGVPGPDHATMMTGDSGTRQVCGVVSEPGSGTLLDARQEFSHAWT